VLVIFGAFLVYNYLLWFSIVRPEMPITAEAADRRSDWSTKSGGRYKVLRGRENTLYSAAFSLGARRRIRHATRRLARESLYRVCVAYQT
jgi:hypothetical protein